MVIKDRISESLLETLAFLRHYLGWFGGTVLFRQRRTTPSRRFKKIGF